MRAKGYWQKLYNRQGFPYKSIWISGWQDWIWGILICGVAAAIGATIFISWCKWN